MYNLSPKCVVWPHIAPDRSQVCQWLDPEASGWPRYTSQAPSVSVVPHDQLDWPELATWGQKCIICPRNASFGLKSHLTGLGLTQRRLGGPDTLPRYQIICLRCLTINWVGLNLPPGDKSVQFGTEMRVWPQIPPQTPQNGRTGHLRGWRSASRAYAPNPQSLRAVLICPPNLITSFLHFVRPVRNIFICPAELRNFN